jgi:uncharacterized SAM-dependent methyltransferase
VRVDPQRHCVEMHLQGQARAAGVMARGRARIRRRRGHRTPRDSHKYTVPGFQDLLMQAGWQPIGCWTDPRQWFGVFAAQPV